MRRALLWGTLLTLRKLYSAVQLGGDIFKSYLELVCSPGLGWWAVHGSAGINQLRRARAEIMKKAAAKRYKNVWIWMC